MSAVARGASYKGPLTPIGARANFTSEGLLKTSNTAAFNLTCGISEGLPVGLMLVAKRYDELTIYQAVCLRRRPRLEKDLAHAAVQLNTNRSTAKIELRV
jgi:hypothetical protein